MTKDPRTEALLDFNSKIQPKELFEMMEQGAAELIETNPFAFALAAVLDRGTKAEIIWTVPFCLEKKIGKLHPQFFLDRSLEELEELFRSLPYKPRYITDAPKTVKDLSKIIVDRFDGDTAKIWQNQSASYVKSVFRQIYGVGPGIASMIVLLLERHFKLHFTDLDHRTMDVKPDVHVIRVFYRMGLIDRPGANEALEAARRLNPEYPGALDAPAWRIGKQWCRPFDPLCSSCIVNSACPRKYTDFAPESISMKTASNRKNQKTCYGRKENSVTERQLSFAKYVEELKQQGIVGEQYRQKVAQWQREHKAENNGDS